MDDVRLTRARDHDATALVVAVAEQDHTSGATLAVPAVGIDLEALERALIVFALASTDGNRTRAARFLGLSRSALIYRMHKHGLATSEITGRKPG